MSSTTRFEEQSSAPCVKRQFPVHAGITLLRYCRSSDRTGITQHYQGHRDYACAANLRVITSRLPIPQKIANSIFRTSFSLQFQQRLPRTALEAQSIADQTILIDDSLLHFVSSEPEFLASIVLDRRNSLIEKQTIHFLE